MSKIAVTFTGSVFSLHVWLDEKEVRLVFDGQKWSGTTDVEPWPVPLRMRFTAVPSTDWAIVAKRDGKKVLDESGTSTQQVVEKVWLLQDGGARLIFDSERGGPLA